jgi:predicted XRE-type DNA-binding protein
LHLRLKSGSLPIYNNEGEGKPSFESTERLGRIPRSGALVPMPDRKLGQRIGEARRARKMLQAELGDQIGVKQPVISELENGKLDAISEGKLKSLLERLNLPPEEFLTRRGQGLRSGPYVACLNPACPTQHFGTVGERLVARPTLLEVGRVAGPRCPECSRELFGNCICGAPLGPGAHCAECGTVFVESKDPQSLFNPELDAWAQERNRNNRASLGLSAGPA